MTSRRTMLFIPLLFLLFTALLCLTALMLGAFGSEDRTPASVIASDTPTEDGQAVRYVVIDAGHGGEDGGAQSTAGLYEKDVNLAVAMALRDLLEANGIPTVMTRTEDVLLYDRNVDYRGRKKVLDLAARLQIAESTEDSLLVSIHMNAFPQTQYSGIQVWYSKNDPLSADIARAVQTGALALQPDNRRRIKAAGSGIFLLDRIETPAILVECGFLSNTEEAARLGDPSYQKDVAFMIFGAIAPYCEQSSCAAVS